MEDITETKLNVIDAKQNMSHKDAPPMVSRASHVVGRTTLLGQMPAPTQRRTKKTDKPNNTDTDESKIQAVNTQSYHLRFMTSKWVH